MKILLFTLLSLSYLKNCNAQFDTSYYYNINKAIVLKMQGKTKESLKLYMMTLKRNKGFNTDYDDAIRLALELGKRKLAIKLSQRAVETNGFQFYNSIRTLNRFNYNDSLFVNVIKQEYPKWRRIHAMKKDDNIIKLSYLIRGLAESEQTVRAYIHSADSSTWKFTDIVDSTNFLEFKCAVETFGFPDISKLDQKIVQDLELLLIHFRTLSVVTNTSNYEMHWLDSLMKSQISFGNIHPTVFAFSFDRYYCLYNKKNKNRELQFYGLFNTLEGYTDIDMIEDVDTRRASIFLLPLSIHAKISNLTPPYNYINK